MNGKGVGRVKVQLFNANNQVVATTATGPRGVYGFRVLKQGTYVVHEVAPRRLVQTSPLFATTAPVGDLAIDPATGKAYTGASWNYHTGNNNPTNGPVGPPSWSTITTQGDEPFESPINITAAPIDLSRYLTINYAPAVPTHILNNAAQIQTQFAANGTDTINLAEVTYNLSQFHYHEPAENQVDGVTYPMEVLGYRAFDRLPVAFEAAGRVKFLSWMASQPPTRNLSN